MRQYIQEVVIPCSKQQINDHGLKEDSCSGVLLMFDVWAADKSKELRRFLRTVHPSRPAFVPANWASKLHVADVIVQRPLRFKHGIRLRFGEDSTKYCG